MPTAKGSQTIRRARAGQPGLTYRVTLWEDGKEYRNDADVKGDLRYIDICYNKSFALVGDTEFKAYQCVSTHTSDEASGKTLTNTALWRELNAFQPVLTGVLLAQQIKASAIDVEDLAAAEAFINALTVKHLKTVDSKGNVVVTIENDGSLTAKSGTFGGKLNAVEGTFKTLTCVDKDGNVAGSITFGSEGTITFAGDMYSQGWHDTKNRNYRFYASNIWCRGSFGAAERNVLEIYGDGGYFYPKGATGSAISVSLESHGSASGITYYTIPTYGTTGDASGFPVDTIVFKYSAANKFYYDIDLFETQRVLLVNANDVTISGVYSVNIYSNGVAVGLTGGAVREAIKLATFLNPVPATDVIGRGVLLGAEYDNNWS